MFCQKYDDGEADESTVHLKNCHGIGNQEEGYLPGELEMAVRYQVARKQSVYLFAAIVGSVVSFPVSAGMGAAIGASATLQSLTVLPGGLLWLMVGASSTNLIAASYAITPAILNVMMSNGVAAARTEHEIYSPARFPLISDDQDDLLILTGDELTFGDEEILKFEALLDSIPGAVEYFEFAETGLGS